MLFPAPEPASRNEAVKVSVVSRFISVKERNGVLAVPLSAQPLNVLRLFVFSGINGIRRVTQRFPPEPVGAVVREQMQFSRHAGVVSGIYQTLRQPLHVAAALLPVCDCAAARREASAFQCRAGRAADRRRSITGAEQNAVPCQPVEVRRHTGQTSCAAQRVEPVLIRHDPEDMRLLHMKFSPIFASLQFFIPLVAIPCTKYRCANRNRIRTGTRTSVAAAIRRP